MKINVFIGLMVCFLSATICESNDSMKLSDTLRCNNGLVSVNDTWYEVKEKCGEPTSFAPGEWVYDFGKQEFLYIIKFRNSKVYRIYNTGNYGLR
jgi:hypothetical protein